MDATRILSGLNEAQRAAVTSPASVLQVLAPPGSGKTKTLTSRVAYLIAQHGLNPRNIIVCTFTNKAAAEMQERITGFLGESIAKKLILGTFHSICRRFLAEHGSLIDLNKKFGIADTSDQKSIIKRIVGTLNLGADSNLPKTVQSRISSCKSKGQTIEQYLASSKGQDKYEFVQIWGEYEEHLRSSNLLDFDDLLLRCCDLLRAHPECVGGIEAVLVDEFQDTNNIQYDLMMLFSQRRQVICIVGDPDQSIYGWRNAEIANLKKMRDKFPETHVEILSENYRTSGAVLQAAQEVIEQDEQRTKKKLMPTHSIGVPAVLRRLPNTDAEAHWLVSEIKRTQALTAGLLTCNDYAILLRSAALSRQIESALGKEGIPYRMVGGHKFFDRMEVKLVLDYLRVISQTSHTEALLRIINVPRRGIGESSLDVLIAAATAKKVPLWEVVRKVAQRGIKLDTKLSEQAIKGLALFSNLIITAQKRLRNPPVDNDTLLDFLKYVLDKVGIPKYLKEKEKDNDSVDYDTRIANIQELVQQASEYSVAVQNGAYHEEPLLQDLGDTAEVLSQGDLAVEEGTAATESTTEDILSKFLANVALATDNQKTQEDGPPKPMVTISTIHAAKGLEWPVVFIPAAYNGSIPHSRAENNDEERRLLYVAMTRAQSLLYLSCPVKDQSRNDVTLSPFLSKQGMDAYFAKSGTTLGYDVVKEISIILRRPCPEAAILGEALISYDWPKDNKWPERGFVDEEEEHTQWETLGADIDYRNGERGFKRPKVGMEDESYGRGSGFERRTPVPGYAFSTTMSNAGGFSSAKTTLPPNAGFMSARDVKIEEPPQKVPKLSKSTSSEMQGQGGKDSKSATAATAGTKKKAKQLPDDQGSLLSFFSRPLSRSVSQDDSTDDPAASLPAPVTVAPAMPVSTPLLRAAPTLPNKSHTTSRPPPTYTRPLPTSQASFHTAAHDENMPPRSAATENGNAKTTAAETQTRPATTFHTTSVAAVVSSERIRKTLGVRRSMQGWAARVNR